VSGLLFLVVVLGLVGLVLAVFHGLWSIEDGRRVDGVQVMKDGFVACYLVDLGEHEVALADTCNDRSAKAILAAPSKGTSGQPARCSSVLVGDNHSLAQPLADETAALLGVGPLAPDYLPRSRWRAGSSTAKMCLAIRARYNVIDVSPLGTLGDALGSLSRHADALDRYEQALAVARRIGDRSLEAIALSDIGVEHTEQGPVRGTPLRAGVLLSPEREGGTERQARMKNGRSVTKSIPLTHESQVGGASLPRTIRPMVTR
jgi:hypothetical protein